MTTEIVAAVVWVVGSVPTALFLAPRLARPVETGLTVRRRVGRGGVQ